MKIWYNKTKTPNLNMKSLFEWLCKVIQRKFVIKIRYCL